MEHKPLKINLIANKFVVRCAQWRWHNDFSIDILDSEGNLKMTLDRSQTWIFYEANGGHTVESLLKWSTDHYRDGKLPPPDLDMTNLQTLLTLVEELNIVNLEDEAHVLPDQYLIPRN